MFAGLLVSVVCLNMTSYCDISASISRYEQCFGIHHAVRVGQGDEEDISDGFLSDD